MASQVKINYHSPWLWISIGTFGLGLIVGILPRSGSDLGKDLLSLAGALAGAGASVAGALFVVDRARRVEEQSARDLLADALGSFYATIQPFTAITDSEIKHNALEATKSLLVAAHEERALVTDLLNTLLVSGRHISARTWITVSAILRVLRKHQFLWEEEQEIIMEEYNLKVTKEVLRVHVEKLRRSSEEMRRYTVEALTHLGRSPPAIGRKNLTDDDDVLSGAISSH